MTQVNQVLADEAATLALGTRLAAPCHGGAVLYLSGDLGAGKTTLTRGLLRGLGYGGTVKSPTYTLVESYVLPALTVHHFDLYRLADAEELEYIGVREFFGAGIITLVEWPEQGRGFLPAADVLIRLEVRGRGRQARLEAATDLGRRILDKFNDET